MLHNMTKIGPFRTIYVCSSLLLVSMLSGCDMKSIDNSIDQWRADQLIKLAHNSIDAKDYRKSIDTLKRAAALAPKYSRIWYELCMAYGYTNEYDLAIQSCQQQVNLDPTAVNYNSLGSAYWEAKQYNKAAEAFEKAVAREDYFIFRSHHVWMLLLSRQYEKAIPTAQRLIEICKEDKLPPTDMEMAYSYLGAAYAGMGQKTNSKVAYQKALEAYENSAEANKIPGPKSCSYTLDSNGQMIMTCQYGAQGVKPTNATVPTGHPK